MAAEYLPLLVLVVVASGFAAIAIIVPSILGPRRENKQKLEPYESGIIPYHDARRRFPVKYYLVAMLFILFDIEVIFIFPWAAVLTELRDNYSALVALAPMGFFLFVLIVGLLYEWKKGALDWGEQAQEKTQDRTRRSRNLGEVSRRSEVKHGS